MRRFRRCTTSWWTSRTACASSAHCGAGVRGCCSSITCTPSNGPQYFPGPVAAVAREAERHGLPRVYRNTHMIAASPSTGADLEALGVPESHIHVVNNGVHVEPVSAPVTRSSEPMFIALGRLAANKRIDLLLDLWTKAAPRTGGKLALVGDGPDAGRSRRGCRTIRRSTTSCSKVG